MQRFRATILAEVAESSACEHLKLVSAENRRRHGRLHTQEMSSTLGNVMDVSRSGLRVRARGKAKVQIDQHLILDIEASEQIVTLPAIVKRVQKVGFNSTDIGLAFPELDDDQSRGLALLAHLAMTTRALKSQ